MINREKLAVKAVLVVTLGLILGCGPKPAPDTDPMRNLSAQGKAAYKATRVIKVLDLIMDTAIAAEAQEPKLMSTNSTRKVVEYHNSIVRTISTVPEGWVPVAKAGALELQKNIPAEEFRQIDPYFRLVFMLIDEVQK